MAGIVDKVFQGTKYVSDTSRHLVGGVVNSVAGLANVAMNVPVMAGKAIAGVPWKNNNYEDYTKHGRAGFERVTGFPTDKPEPGSENSFAFGQGIIGATNPTAAVVGGLTNAAATRIAPDSPIAQAAINIAAPMAIGKMIGGGAKSINAMVDERAAQNIDGPFPLTKGEATGKAKLLDKEHRLALKTDTADDVAFFRKRQASAAKEEIEKFLNKANLAKDADAGTEAAAAFKKYKDTVLEKHKALNAKEFDVLNQPFAKEPIVDTAPIVDAYKKLIKQHDTPNGGEISEAITKEARKQLNELLGSRSTKVIGNFEFKAGKKAPVEAISLKDVQSNLEALGAAAYPNSPVKFFANIAPGSDMGAVKTILGAYKDALKQTAELNTPHGAFAKQLVQARTGFFDRSQELQKLDDTALSVFFDTGKTGTRMALKPEQVMDKLRSMKPTERQFFVGIAEQTNPTVVENLRESMVDQIIKKGNVTGGADRTPSFSITDIAIELEKKKDDFHFLFPDPEKRRGVLNFLDHAKKAENAATLTQDVAGKGMEAAGIAALAHGATGAGTGTTMASRAFVDWAWDAIISPKSEYLRLFEGKTPKRGVTKTLLREFSDNAQAIKDQISSGTSVSTIGAREAGKVLNEQSQEMPLMDKEQLTPFGPTESAPVPSGGQQEAAPSGELPSPDSLGLPDPDEVLKGPGTSESLPDPEGLPAPDASQKKSDLSPILDQIAYQESKYNPKAVNPKSGALGMFQFMPETAKQYGIDPMDPKQAYQGAEKHVQYLMSKYKGDLKKVLAAYNWGEGNVDKHGLEKAPKETRDYIKDITSRLNGNV